MQNNIWKVLLINMNEANVYNIVEKFNWRKQVKTKNNFRLWVCLNCIKKNPFSLGIYKIDQKREKVNCNSLGFTYSSTLNTHSWS